MNRELRITTIELDDIISQFETEAEVCANKIWETCSMSVLNPDQLQFEGRQYKRKVQREITDRMTRINHDTRVFLDMYFLEQIFPDRQRPIYRFVRLSGEQNNPDRALLNGTVNRAIQNFIDWVTNVRNTRGQNQNYIIQPSQSEMVDDTCDRVQREVRQYFVVYSGQKLENESVLNKKKSRIPSSQ